MNFNSQISSIFLRYIHLTLSDKLFKVTWTNSGSISILGPLVHSRRGGVQDITDLGPQWLWPTKLAFPNPLFLHHQLLLLLKKVPIQWPPWSCLGISWLWPLRLEMSWDCMANVTLPANPESVWCLNSVSINPECNRLHWNLNLEKWYWRIYLQDSSGETDVENRFMDMRRGRRRWCMEQLTWKLTSLYVK